MKALDQVTTSGGWGGGYILQSSPYRDLLIFVLCYGFDSTWVIMEAFNL